MKVKIIKVPENKQVNVDNNSSAARNAAKWHGDGGIIDRLDQHFSGDTDAMLNIIRKAMGR